MTQSNLLELARQGDPQAIATLMNRTLQPKGITAQTALQGDRLRVLLEADQVPNRQAMVTFVRHGITSLGVTNIREIEIVGRQTNSDRSAWAEEVYLGMPVTATSETAPVSGPASPVPPPRAAHLRLVPPPVPPFRPTTAPPAEASDREPPAEAPVYQVIDQPVPLVEAQPDPAPPAASHLEVVPLPEASDTEQNRVVSPVPIPAPPADWSDADDRAAQPPAAAERRSQTPLVWLVLLLMVAWSGSIIGYALWQDLSAPSSAPIDRPAS